MTQRYSLRIETGEREGETVPVAAFPFAIGRKPGNALQILDASVSGRHAELAQQGGEIVLRDLGSTNGSRVGSERVLEERVPPGGRFSLGNVAFTLLDREVSPIPLAGPNDPAPAGAADRADEGRLARARRGSRAGPLLLVALAAAAGGAWWWTRSGGGGRVVETRPVPTFAGALFAATFEGEGNPRTSEWESGGDAVGAFLRSARARSSGERGFAASLGENEDARSLSPEIPVQPGTALVAAVEMRATGEARGRLGVEFLAADDAAAPVAAWSAPVADGGTFATVEVPARAPAGYDRARLVLAAEGRGGGAVHADDARLVPGAVEAEELSIEPFRLQPVGRAWNLFLIDRTLLSGLSVRPEGGGAFDAREIGVRVEGPAFRFDGAAGGVLVARVEPPLAAGGLATLGPGGYLPRGEDFEAEDVTDLVLGRGVDLVRLSFGEPVPVRGRADGAGWRVRATLPAGVEPGLQVAFQAERAATVNLVADAEQAERAGEIGACLVAWRELLDRYPFEERVVRRAQSERARHLQAGFAELAAIDDTLERADFFQLPDLYEDCRERAREIESRYAPSEVGDAADALIARIDGSLAELAAEGDRLETQRRRGILGALERAGAEALAAEVRATIEANTDTRAEDGAGADGGSEPR